MITMDDIIREGHPTLRKKAEEITFPVSQEIKELGLNMMEFLLNSQNPDLAEKYGLRAGVGLAAPQVNVSKRLIAVHIPDDSEENDEEDDTPLFSAILVNPKIVSHSVQSACLADGEGCLSVDRDIPGYVPRYNRIRISYYDLEGEKHSVRLKEYPAIVLQHEMDHLNGILFYDHINSEEPYRLEENTNVIS